MAPWAVLSIVVLHGMFVPSAQSTAKPIDPSTIDAKVISAALTSFYRKAEWRAEDWSKGDLVVVSPYWSHKSRPAFETMLDNMIVSAFFRSNAEAELKQLDEIKASILREGDAFDPGQKQQLGELVLDERIVISSVTRDITQSREKTTIENRSGKLGTIRTSGSLAPPTYSHDGRYSIVHMGGIPWGLHSASLTFILERDAKTWKVIYVTPRYTL
jgi:hypothetical protein